MIKLTTLSLMSAFYIGCASDEKTKSEEKSAPTEQSQKLELGKAFATVNKVELHQKNLDVEIEGMIAESVLMNNFRIPEKIFVQEVIELLSQKDAESISKTKETYGERFKEQMIVKAAINQAAIKSKVAEDPMVKLRIKEATQKIINNAYLEQVARAKVTDDSVKQEYETTKEIKHRNDEYQFTVFKVDSSEKADALKAVISEKGDVDAKIAELGIKGESDKRNKEDYFEALKQVRDPSRAMMMQQEIMKMISEIEETKEGDFIGDPQEINGVFHFQRLDKIVENIIPFEEVKAELKLQALLQEFGTLQQKIRTEADVTRFDEEKKEEASSEKTDAHAGHNH